MRKIPKLWIGLVIGACFCGALSYHFSPSSVKDGDFLGERALVQSSRRSSSRAISGKEKKALLNAIKLGWDADLATVEKLGITATNDEWNSFLSTTIGRPDRKVLLESFVKGWAKNSFEDALEACSKIEDGGSLLVQCVKVGDGEGMAFLRQTMSSLDLLPGEQARLEMEMWKRWGEVAPEVAIFQFSRNDSPTLSLHSALVNGLVSACPPGRIDVAIGRVTRLMDSIDPEYEEVVIRELATARVPDTEEFRSIVEFLSKMRRDGRINEEKYGRVTRDFYYTAVNTMPRALITEVQQFHDVPEVVIAASLFQIGKDNFGGALELVDWNQVKVDSNGPADKFVQSAMSYDPSGLVKYVESMKNGREKDLTVVMIAKVLEREEAREWAGLIEDPEVRDELERYLEK